MKFKSIKFKISVLYIVILGIILALYSSFLYFSLYSTLYHDLDKDLLKKISIISGGISDYMQILNDDTEYALIFAARRIITLKGEYPGSVKPLSAQQKKRIIVFEREWAHKHDKLDLSEDYIHLVNLDGQSIVKSRNISAELRAVFLKKFKNKQKEGITFTKFKFKKRNLRFIQSPIYFDDTPKGILQIGTSQKPIIDLLQNRQSLILISIPIILIFASFIGRYLVDKILTPVDEITQMARNITHEDLSGRIKIKNVDEEMYSLVEALNDMIARLEQSFKHIAEFSSQVAHEIKTPIAILRGEVELALRKDRTHEEYKRVLKVSLEETKRLLNTVEDLLLLAKLDYRPEIFKFEKFDFKKFIKELHEQTKILSSEKDIVVELTLPESEILVSGDKLHLRRLFFNIIHNAVKFTPQGGHIDIAVRTHDHRVAVSISDTGIGIAKEDVCRVFDRFFHIEAPDQDSDPGNGLGLNIALSIAKIHQGTIDVASQINKGSTFTVTLPIA